MRRRATVVIDRKLTLEDGTILQAVVWELPMLLKGDHEHVMGKEYPYAFRDIPTLLEDFREEVERAGGKI